mgnify:CR=1 FL=1
MKAVATTLIALLALAACSAEGDPNGLGTPSPSPQPSTRTVEPEPTPSPETSPSPEDAGPARPRQGRGTLRALRPQRHRVRRGHRRTGRRSRGHALQGPGLDSSGRGRSLSGELLPVEPLQGRGRAVEPAGSDGPGSAGERREPGDLAERQPVRDEQRRLLRVGRRRRSSRSSARHQGNGRGG